MGAYETLTAEGVKARVVSMPSWELFEQQDQAYRDQVLPPAVKGRVAVEQAATLGWDRYVGMGGGMIGMHTLRRLGAAGGICRSKFGFTPEAVLETKPRKQAKRSELKESRAMDMQTARRPTR